MMNGRWYISWWVHFAFASAFCSALLAEPSDALLGKMNSDDYDIRTKAYSELKVWAKKNLKASPEQLHKAWKKSGDPEVKSRCYELMKDMVIMRMYGKGQGFIGIRMQEAVVKDPENNKSMAGVQITLVMPDTPGQKAGLKMNDVILGVDQFKFGEAKGQRPNAGFGGQMNFDTVTRFGEYIKSKQPDETVTLHIIRAVKKMEIQVKLMKRPDSADVGVFGSGVLDKERERKAFFNNWLKSMENPSPANP